MRYWNECNGTGYESTILDWECNNSIYRDCLWYDNKYNSRQYNTLFKYFFIYLVINDTG